MSLGKIVFLHGASSSGKSTIAASLQGAMPEPFWHISIDKLRDSGVLPSERFNSGEFDWKIHRAAFSEGYHRSLAAYARAGNNLIIEHIIEQQDWRTSLATLFEPFDFFFVKVDCPLDVLQERENIRGDRPKGSAQRDFETIHEGLEYDCVVDGTARTDQSIKLLLAAWRQRAGKSSFFAALNA